MNDIITELMYASPERQEQFARMVAAAMESPARTAAFKDMAATTRTIRTEARADGVTGGRRHSGRHDGDAMGGGIGSRKRIGEASPPVGSSAKFCHPIRNFNRRIDRNE